VLITVKSTGSVGRNLTQAARVTRDAKPPAGGYAPRLGLRTRRATSAEMTQRIVFFDLETAGLEPQHAVIQVAAIATENFAEIDAFEAKLQFDATLADPGALDVNHYDPELWARVARPERDVVYELGRFFSKHATVERISKRTGNPYKIAWVAGHNIQRFDIPRLERMFKTYNQFLPADTYRPLDTLQLAWWHAVRSGEIPDAFKLSALCAQLGIDARDAHDALADVRLSLQVAKKLLAA
jgi:DNA polymerase III epsilon subunit-like protein